MTADEQFELLLSEIKESRLDIKEIKAWMLGNGRPGVFGRLDKIEDRSRTMCKALWIFFISGVGIMGKIIWSYFTEK